MHPQGRADMVPRRRSILVLSDLRAAVPTTVQPFAGIDRYVRERGLHWDLIVEPRSPRARAGGRRQFDGIIGRLSLEAAAFAAASEIPAVNTWASSPAQAVPMVSADFAAAGSLAAEFLVARGLRQLVFLGTNLPFSKPLADGFQERAASLGGRCRVARVAQAPWWFDRNDSTFTRFMARLQKLVATLEPPVGVFGFDDFACRYFVRACEERGLAVPGDVAVLGITNNVMACMHPPPSLSSVDLNLELVGYRAAELLDSLMQGRKPPSQPILVPPLGIVPRQSTDNYVADDESVAEALKFIAARHGSRLRPSHVAKHVAMSERTLQRKFAATLGHSIVREIVLQRMRRAKQLLVDTDHLVKQVAREVGFGDSQQFCRTFQRFEGISPNSYRERYKS